MLKLTYRPFSLKLKHPFVLASGSRNFTESVMVALHLEKEFTGYGIASLPPYLKETSQSVLSFLDKVEPDKLDWENLKKNGEYFDVLAPENTAAKAAIDLALHDLKGKILKKSLSQLYEISSKEVHSFYTIGISTINELKLKLAEAENFNFIKLKLGSGKDKQIVEAYLNHCNKPFAVDVNQGWKDKHQALDMVHWLKDKNALFVEQPMPVKMFEETAWLCSYNCLPIVADESVQRYDDLVGLQGVFSGVNIKLMKSTGVFEAYKMIKKAKELGFKVLMGCMAESTCAVTAAGYLASMADWADLDGFHLVENDPFCNGIKVKKGLVMLPEQPGIGVDLCYNNW